MLSVHRLLWTWTRQVNRYIALTEFMRQKFVSGGFPAKQIVVKPNFVRDEGRIREPGDAFLYVGRLAEHKGQSQAWVLREALLAYDAGLPDKNYAMFDMWKDTPPGAAPAPEDLQEYSDSLDEVMAEGLLAEYEEQKREMEKLFG